MTKIIIIVSSDGMTALQIKIVLECALQTVIIYTNKSFEVLNVLKVFNLSPVNLYDNLYKNIVLLFDTKKQEEVYVCLYMVCF